MRGGGSLRSMIAYGLIGRRGKRLTLYQTKHNTRIAEERLRLANARLGFTRETGRMLNIQSSGHVPQHQDDYRILFS